MKSILVLISFLCGLNTAIAADCSQQIKDSAYNLVRSNGCAYPENADISASSYYSPNEYIVTLCGGSSYAEVTTDNNCNIVSSHFQE